MKNTHALALVAASFVAGFVLASQLVSKTVKLYVSKPGEYFIDAPGGNSISVFTFPRDGRPVQCDYLEDSDDYRGKVTNDVLFGRTNIEPQCFASFVESQ